MVEEAPLIAALHRDEHTGHAPDAGDSDGGEGDVNRNVLKAAGRWLE